MDNVIETAKPAGPPKGPGFTAGMSGLLFVFAGIWIIFYIIHVKGPETSGMPASETAFVNTILNARSAWQVAPNSVAQVPMQASRAAAICGGKATLTAAGWTGAVQNIETNSLTDKNGKNIATVWIALTPHISLMTPRASIASDPDATIRAGSPIYNTAGTLKNGTKISFSGQFLPSISTCFTEMSLNPNGSMSDPLFEMQITALSAASG